MEKVVASLQALIETVKRDAAAGIYDKGCEAIEQYRLSSAIQEPLVQISSITAYRAWLLTQDEEGLVDSVQDRFADTHTWNGASLDIAMAIAILCQTRGVYRSSVEATTMAATSVTGICTVLEHAVSLARKGTVRDKATVILDALQHMTVFSDWLLETVNTIPRGKGLLSQAVLQPLVDKAAQCCVELHTLRTL